MKALCTRWANRIGISPWTVQVPFLSPLPPSYLPHAAPSPRRVPSSPPSSPPTISPISTFPSIPPSRGNPPVSSPSTTCPPVMTPWTIPAGIRTGCPHAVPAYSKAALTSCRSRAAAPAPSPSPASPTRPRPSSPTGKSLCSRPFPTLPMASRCALQPPRRRGRRCWAVVRD